MGILDSEFYFKELQTVHGGLIAPSTSGFKTKQKNKKQKHPTDVHRTLVRNESWCNCSVLAELSVHHDLAWRRSTYSNHNEASARPSPLSFRRSSNMRLRVHSRYDSDPMNNKKLFQVVTLPTARKHADVTFSTQLPWPLAYPTIRARSFYGISSTAVQSRLNPWWSALLPLFPMASNNKPTLTTAVRWLQRAARIVLVGPQPWLLRAWHPHLILNINIP